MYTLLAARSTGAAATTTARTGAGAGIGTAMSAGSALAAISPAAGFGFYGVPFNVCGEGELVGGVHTLVWRCVQVYHELQELEDEDKGREEVQEIERESQVEEKHSREDDHVDGVKDSNILSRGACARDDVKL